jgi:N-acyl-D-amino-acid deacylase
MSYAREQPRSNISNAGPASGVRASSYCAACLALLGIALSGAFAADPETFDVVIEGGAVYVGDGSPPVVADVAITRDKIALVGKADRASASKTIDARGLVVAPGFINMLSWSTESLIADGRSEGEIRQGVTTQVFGEGQSMGPLNGAMKRRRKAAQTFVRFDYDWTTLSEYLLFLERRGVAQNVASLVGAGTVREHVLGLANRRPSAAELEQMERLVDDAMRDGALGVGSALVYPPGSYATTEELIALAKVAARHGGMYISHIRDQGPRFVEATDELIRIAREAGVRAEVYHIGAAGEANWPKMTDVVRHIEAARRDGLHVTANMHAYHAGCTGLTACLPPWAQEGGADAMLRRLTDPAVRRKIAADIRGEPKGWENPYRLLGSPDRLMPVHFQSESLKPLEGMTLAQIASQRGKDPIDTLMDLIAEDRSRVETVYFTDTEENVREQIKIPWITFGSDAASIATDGMFRGMGTHPRAFGNFARVLGKYVRDEKLLSLEQAIHRMTGLPAANLRLDRRGLVRVGFFADVVVFDPATIADRATFDEPQQYAVGVRHVFVNGVQVLDDGRHTGALPGRAVWRGGRANAPGTPKGLDDAAQSRESASAPWDTYPPRSSSTPKGLDRPPHSSVRPFQGTVRATLATQGALADSRPWAALWNPFGAVPAQSDEVFRLLREELVRESLEKAEPPIKNRRVLDSMRTTPRHQFVSQQYRRNAYVDTVLPIGHGQTISPPFIVAYMTEKIDPQPGDRVLEIGTGSGYQAAVLSPLVKEVYTIEIVEPLGRRAAEVLKRLEYDNVFVKIGDGYKGWPEKAPFDKIIVTCSPDHVPQPLIDQLREGGTMIIPVGERYQQSFHLVEKRDGKLQQQRLLGTFFVPMTGEAERQRRDNPDGSRPAVTNGNFELQADVDGGPENWYYHRGVRIEDDGAPEGKRFVAYTNDDPGHLTHSNQGFAIDGKRIESLDLSFWVMTEAVRPGPKPEHTAGITITFFDRNRSYVSTVRAGPFEGTNSWGRETQRIAVPRTAQDAVIMIGLSGATGRIAFDDIQFKPVMRGAK